MRFVAQEIEQMSSRNTHENLANQLRSRIMSGALRHGDRLPSFKQLHRQFGAASMTVNKAFLSLERDGLIERRARSGVYVAKVTGRRRHPRVAVTGFATGFAARSDYWSRLVGGIQSTAQAAGLETAYLPMVDEILYDPEIQWDAYDALIGLPEVSGHVFSTRPSGLPAVGIGLTQGVPSFGANEYAGGFTAGQHLCRLHHENICYIGWKSTETADQRIRGIRSALMASLLNPDCLQVRPLLHANIVPGDFVSLGKINMEQWFADGFANLKCTGLIVQGDYIAVGMIHSLNAHGYRVPEDISVVGFDNELNCLAEDMPLTSVFYDMFELGARAVNTLTRLIAGENIAPEATLLPPTIIERASTGPRSGVLVRSNRVSGAS